MQQTPLKELVVFHPSAEYLTGVRALLPYIEQELNVRTVTLTSDEAATGILYRAEADWSVLGRKVRKEMGKVKADLLTLTSDEVQSYVETGKITVGGCDLIEGDLTVVRYVKPLEGQEDGSAKYETHTDNDVVILLDVLVRPELAQEGLAREVINRVQRLRKKAGCVPTDDIEVYYRFAEGMGAELRQIILASEDIIMRVLKRLPLPDEQRPASDAVLVEEEQDIGEEKLTLVLVRM